MTYYDDELYHYDDELYHYGVKGMKWGVRRFQRNVSNGVARIRRKGSKFYKEHKKGIKRAAKIAGAAAGAAALAYGVHKLRGARGIARVGGKKYLTYNYKGPVGMIGHKPNLPAVRGTTALTTRGTRSLARGANVSLYRGRRGVSREALRALGIGGAVGTAGFATAAAINRKTSKKKKKNRK